MKRLLPACFLPLAITFTLHAGVPVICEKPDTVIVHSTGRYNKVVIDSIQLNDSLTEPIISPVKGEIIQTGENNRVEIKTGGEKPKNNTQITNNHQITNSQKPETCNLLKRSVYPDGRNPDISSGKPATSNQQPGTSNLEPGTSNQQHVTIKQTG